MKFSYQARNKEGQIKNGFVVAASQDKAEQLLTENGFIILNLQIEEEDFWSRFNPFTSRVNYKELVLFSRQLSTLISARVPILQALRVLERQITGARLVSIIRDMIASVENGESFSLALSKHPQVFGNIYVSLVRSGEASGSVAQSLAYLADQLEKDYELRRKVKGALTYPVFVLVALVVVGMLMFKFVLPKLTAVLKEQGGTLPGISVAIISLTDFFAVYWWLIILLLACLVLGVRYYIITKQGRYLWDELKIKIPILGEIFQKIYLARFSRSLATLVAGGIPIIQAIQIVAETVNNEIYREILLDAAIRVTNGSSISDALSPRSDEFPPIVTQMIRVGEQTAQLDDILAKLATFYEKEVDSKIAVLAQLLEPVIMIILGIAVGALVAGILLPIYNIASTAT